MTILINCTGKFCYGQGDFQNTEAATRGVLKIFTKFTGKHLCQSLFFNIAADLRLAILLKRDSNTRIFMSTFPVGIYLLKINNRNTRTRCEICSKLTIKTPERR